MEWLHRQLEQVSVTDELTGVDNRRSLMTRGARLLASPSADSPTGAAIAILDIDHFKIVNDTYGHGGGDQVLREFAQYLRAGLREREYLISAARRVDCKPGSDCGTVSGVLREPAVRPGRQADAEPGASRSR